MTAQNELEEGSALRLDWEKLAKLGARGQRVVPVVLQHADSGEVLFVGYANELALRETLARRQAVLWSTSRDELWHKGATSGSTLDVREVRYDCDEDVLLVKAHANGPACHTGERSCFFRVLP